MKKTILLVVLLTLVAFISGAIATAPPKAATTPAPAAPASTAPVKLEKFSGDIKSVDAVAKSIVVAKGKVEKTFVVNDETKITKGKDTLSFADLKAGMNVALEYKKDGDKLIAVTIKVSAPKAAPKAK
jgi:Cu/Ag efflux protein CusF